MPEGLTPQQHLEQLTWEGAAKRYPDGIPDKARKILEGELKLIGELNYAPYFLTVQDIVRFAYPFALDEISELALVKTAAERYAEIGDGPRVTEYLGAARAMPAQETLEPICRQLRIPAAIGLREFGERGAAEITAGKRGSGRPWPAAGKPPCEAIERSFSSTVAWP